MEEALKLVMPWLSAQDVGELGCTCREMAGAARLVTGRRVGDATQGWESVAVPIENRVDDCLYPEYQYTPFSILNSSASRHRFGGPWGGGREVAERRTLSESEYGGAIRAGSVLRGTGIGCRCRNDCSAESHDFSDCWSPECSAEEGAGRSSRSRAGGHPHSETLERWEEGFEKKSRFEEHVVDSADAEGAEYALIEGHGCNEEGPRTGKSGSVNKRQRFSVRVSSCPCGRFMGVGKVAYDSNSRLRIQSIQTSAAMAQEQVLPGGPDVEETRNVVQVQRCEQMDGGKGLAGVHEPPLIMECGQVCSCNDVCKYRVSQHGLAVRTKVVRTRFKGWGLWALQEIKQGSFVCEYAGELMTIQKARERQNIYDSEKHGKHWQGSALLTLREHLPSGQASVRVNVDATRVGNVARFINHSCDGGNLMPCLIRTAGCIIPKLALFARRDVSDGEELTYSYGTADKDAAAAAQKPCFCGASACFGWLPSEST